MGQLPDPPPILATPSEEEIARSRRNAVELGGAALNLEHSKRSTVFTVKVPGLPGPPQQKRLDLTTCDHVALFTLPVDEQGWEKGDPARANATRICAVCDGGVDFPRLAGEVER